MDLIIINQVNPIHQANQGSDSFGEQIGGWKKWVPV
jgi:hypothetical protein